MKVEAGIRFLAEQGLNLVAILDCATLPDKITNPMRTVGIEMKDHCRLLLTAHGGKQLWKMLPRSNDPDPVDSYSLQATQLFLQNYLDAPPARVLYPGDYPLSLQKLGALAGWHSPSPLGIGIHQDYGLWWAYRTAVLIDADLPIIKAALPPRSPCDDCAEKWCVEACPVTAVYPAKPLDFPRCMNHRLQPDSSCADRCLSRIACPIAPQHRYTTEQINYHYGESLITLKQWAHDDYK